MSRAILDRLNKEADLLKDLVSITPIKGGGIVDAIVRLSRVVILINEYLKVEELIGHSLVYQIANSGGRPKLTQLFTDYLVDHWHEANDRSFRYF